MATIGAGWVKSSEKCGHYISVNISKEILPLTITSDKMLMLRPYNSENIKENSPDYLVDIFIPEKQEN